MKPFVLGLALVAGSAHAQLESAYRDAAQTTMLAVDGTVMAVGLVTGLGAALSSSGSHWRATSLVVGLANLGLGGASLYVAMTSELFYIHRNAISDPALLVVGGAQLLLGVANVILPFIGLTRAEKATPFTPMVLRGRAGGRPWTGLGVEVRL